MEEKDKLYCFTAYESGSPCKVGVKATFELKAKSLSVMVFLLQLVDHWK